MRFVGFCLLVLITSAGFSAQSHAESWKWWPSNWQNTDFQPYIGQQQLHQRSLWDGDTWTPEAWEKDAGDSRRIMRDLYAAGILTDQYSDGKNIPVLEVGEGFFLLSSVDQRRVLQFVDYVFEITTSEENGMFYVYYKLDNDKPAGLYNKYGFQSY
tara:strand:+ start:255 stop:722 length:468 start_codon:yes stop_codon:yes gene_type:complete